MISIMRWIRINSVILIAKITKQRYSNIYVENRKKKVHFSTKKV